MLISYSEPDSLPNLRSVSKSWKEMTLRNKKLIKKKDRRHFPHRFSKRSVLKRQVEFQHESHASEGSLMCSICDSLCNRFEGECTCPMCTHRELLYQDRPKVDDGLVVYSETESADLGTIHNPIEL